MTQDVVPLEVECRLSFALDIQDEPLVGEFENQDADLNLGFHLDLQQGE